MNEQLRAIAEVDRIIHEPGRMMIVALLAAVKECDFLFLQNETGLSKGNLSSHLVRLEAAEYVAIAKGFRGRVPQTVLRLTPVGRRAFDKYRERMNGVLQDEFRHLDRRGKHPGDAAVG